MPQANLLNQPVFSPNSSYRAAWSLALNINV